MFRPLLACYFEISGFGHEGRVVGIKETLVFNVVSAELLSELGLPPRGRPNHESVDWNAGFGSSPSFAMDLKI
jgi:hypothetical protein